MEMGMDPVHPGECIRDSVEAMGWAVGETAAQLGVSRAAFSRVLNARAAVSVEMALALEALGWGSAEFWVRMQGDYDLTLARRSTEKTRRGRLPREGVRAASRGRRRRAASHRRRGAPPLDRKDPR